MTRCRINGKIKTGGEIADMIKAVLFDIDDTILDFDKCASWAIKTAMDERDTEYHEEMYSVFKRINDDLWSRLEKGEISRQELLDRRFCEIFDALGVSLDGREFEERFIELLHESSEEVPDARELLCYLRAKGYKIYAVSNAMQLQQENRLKNGGLMMLFDGVFTSELLGASKPSSAFFDGFFERVCDLSPDEVIIVGDSLSADITGGKQYGIKTCWFNNGGRNSLSGSFSDYVVTSLSAIKRFL